MFTQGNGPERAISDKRRECNVSAILLRQKNIDLRELDKQLSKTRVLSPIDGVVTSLDALEGEIAISATESLNGGTPLVTVSDVNRLEVVSQIGEADFTSVKYHSKVVIRPEARKGVSTEGLVSFVALTAKKRGSNQLSTFEVRVAIDSLVEGIAPGVTVNVEFVLNERKGVIGVPCEFVTCSEKDTVVTKPPFSSDKSKTARTVSVSLGATNYEYYEIIKGLKEGDTICRISDQSVNASKTNSGSANE